MGVFAMPSLGADMEAGTLAEWLVKPGDHVARGDVVAVVETQKGAIEIEIFEEGTVHELKAGIGEELPVGAPLAIILGAGEDVPQTATPERPDEAPDESPAPAEPGKADKPEPAPAGVETPPASTGGLRASPAARMLARELGVALDGIEGSGPEGAIVLSDVEQQERPRPETSGKKPAASRMDEMRRAIAAAMTRSKQTIPHFYVSDTIDIQAAVDWLATRNADRPPAERVLLGALLVRAVSLSARATSALNGQFIDGAFRASDAVNTGVAISLRGGGLVAPALLGADRLSLDETMAAMRDLVTRARAGRLRSSEMSEGTITVSSLGDGGGEAMAGVIFPPQVALVGIGAPRSRPWIVDGEVVPRQVITITLSADHRAADGRQAAAFLEEIAKFVATPEMP